MVTGEDFDSIFQLAVSGTHTPETKQALLQVLAAPTQTWPALRRIMREAPATLLAEVADELDSAFDATAPDGQRTVSMAWRMRNKGLETEVQRYGRKALHVGGMNEKVLRNMLNLLPELPESVYGALLKSRWLQKEELIEAMKVSDTLAREIWDKRRELRFDATRVVEIASHFRNLRPAAMEWLYEDFQPADYFQLVLDAPELRTYHDQTVAILMQQASGPTRNALVRLMHKYPQYRVWAATKFLERAGDADIFLVIDEIPELIPDAVLRMIEKHPTLQGRIQTISPSE